MKEYPEKEKSIITSVTVKAMSEVSRVLGWSEREVKFEGSTLEGLLRSLVTLSGQSLYSLLVKDGKLRGGYVISVNSQVVTSLETPLNYGDRVLTMEMVRLFQGG
jgi:sulfur carrier protein ThiS